jgi:hypothetical protein
MTDPKGHADEGRRRRRRRRPSRGTGPGRVVPTATTDEPDRPEPEAAAVPKPARKRRPARDGGAERGLRDLVGAGQSQLGVDGALRGRDVNRPSEQDLAEAERDVVIVRRNWKPSDPS